MQLVITEINSYTYELTWEDSVGVQTLIQEFISKDDAMKFAKELQKCPRVFREVCTTTTETKF